MPRQPHWFQHVATALAELRASPSPVLNRVSLEKLLHVSRRTAIRLLHVFGGFQAGRTFLIPREELIAALENVQKRETFGHELRRRSRLGEDLERTRQDLQARQVKLPVAPDARSAASLPSGMRIRSGVLEVEFGSGEELLGRLYELVQTAAEDLEGFEALLVNPETRL